MKRTRTLLALAVYPERVAATRYRVIQMFPYLRARGWRVRFVPFIEDDFLDVFYSSGVALTKASYLASRTLRRFREAIAAVSVDAVFIQREAALIGPPFAELIYSLKGTPIIFDFDDAIWEQDLPRSKHPLAARWLKNPAKCWNTMSRAKCVIAGSRYLATRAFEVNSNVEVAPTVVSAAVWTPLPCRGEGNFHGGKTPRIGWIGTHSTAHQLALVQPALRQLRAEGHDFEMHVVGASEDFALSGIEVHKRRWRLDREVREFQEIDIGLAPMCNGPAYEGKCGFKQLQYMAAGVPCVSSWVGGAKDFVVDGDNGLIAHDNRDWYRNIRSLLRSSQLRKKISQNGRRLVETKYSIEHQGPRIADFVDEAWERSC